MEKAKVLAAQSLVEKRGQLPPWYKTRKLRRDDLPTLERLGEEQDFEIGLENLQIFFDISSTYGWNCIVDTSDGKDDIVAYEATNVLENGLGFGFLVFVRADMRGRGLTRLFDSFYLDHAVDCGNATPYSIQRWKFEVWRELLVGYTGMARVGRLHRITLDPTTQTELVWFNEQMLDELVEYDKTVSHLDRKEFLRRWCQPSTTTTACTLIAQQGKKIVGYATLRETTSYKTLAPFYADTPQTARQLLKTILQTLRNDDNFYVKFSPKNATMIECMHVLGLLQTETEFSHCSRRALGFIESIDLTRVYGMHEFWPV